MPPGLFHLGRPMYLTRTRGVPSLGVLLAALALPAGAQQPTRGRQLTAGDPTAAHS